LVGEGRLGSVGGPLVVVLGGLVLAEGVVPVGFEAVGDEAVVGVDGHVTTRSQVGSVAGPFDVACS
jgi:hypothetical protein